ncbi:hypothetical protein VXS03_14885 [Photobacterium sp. S4TG1]|uniref:hypothetical protein n=1 Tax=Photobacterium sp. S4TG1 TaxID=3114587 RepID=UPI002E179202|nr:hypothetical protein [Photobacterium sp. S4TG1]
MTPRPFGYPNYYPFYIDEKKPESFDSGFLIVVGEELGSNISEPPTLCYPNYYPFYIDEKKPESFDSGFLMMVGEELGSNIGEPPTLWLSKLLFILYRRKKT